jgi:predicted amidohydrolase YtcJ
MRQLFENFRWAFSGETQNMLVEGGRVVARQPNLNVSVEVPRTNLNGRWLMPSFVDAHCHILPTGLDLIRLHLDEAECHGDVLDLVRQRHAEEPEGWLRAVHYDQNRYGDVHLTRTELDKISADRPIFLCHVNGHASVANSAALRASGINESTPDPEGGRYARDSSGKITGVLLEAAHEFVLSSAPKPTKASMVEAIVRAGRLMNSEGIGCATDMMTGFFDLEDELDGYRSAATAGCPIHTRLYVQWNEVFGPNAKPDALERVRQLTRLDPRIGKTDWKDVRVTGIKIFADGAISSGTAAIYGRFQGGSSSSNPSASETDGQLMHTPDRLNEMVRIAHDAGFAIAIHSIGDYSTDLVMDALARTGEPSRHRIEHAMMLEDRQIERLAELKIHCTFQPEFLTRLGPSYRRQLGEDRASRLIRTRSALAAGIPTSFSSDRPIVAGNPWDGVSAASNRPPEFDPLENCSREQAVLAYTAGGALANGEESLMGSLAPGSLADFQECAGRI